MNKVEIIKGIEMTIEGLNAIKLALGESEGVAPEKENKDILKRAEPVKKEEPVKEETPIFIGKFDKEQLNSMKYNEFKKLAASLGVKCTGTRDEIMERILALDEVSDGDTKVVSEPEEEAKPVKSVKSSTGKKLGAKKVEEPSKDEFDEQAEEVAKETAIEDIIEALADVNVKATKKNAVQKLAEALREGLISLDDEDEDEDVPTGNGEAPEADSDDEEEISATSYFPEYDPEGYNNPEDMTDERKEAIETKVDEILTSYSEGEITEDDVVSYVEDNATEAEIDLLGDEYNSVDIFKLYIELVKRTIDNDGEEHEQGEPYEVGDKDLCCGHELKYVKKTKKYVCEHCGTEYEAE